MDKHRVRIRPATEADEPFLREMLYQAIYTPPGSPLPPRDIVYQSGLNRYVDDWGRPGDTGLIAALDGQPVGAVWLRLLTGGSRGYGYVNDDTPELSLAILPEYRGRGLGTRLLANLLDEAAKHFPAVSLSVAAENPAVRLYERHGFILLKMEGQTATMIRYLSHPPDMPQ